MNKAGRKQAVLRKVSARGKAKKKTSKGRVKKLNDAALKLVDRDAEKIAQSLLDSAIGGHVLSARLLVELAEGQADPEEAENKRSQRTLAMDLAEEPQWEGDSLETQAEIARASHEPEAA
jgi:hypothetical protein